MNPIAPGLYKAQLTMSRAMRDKLQRAKNLLGYRRSVPDETEILEIGLDLVIARLEKQKFGATEAPRMPRRSNSARHVSNDVKREVWERDGGRCTYVSAAARVLRAADLNRPENADGRPAPQDEPPAV